eukprot:jgi/Botrbrau1/14831/Bobra.0278s0001.1
MRGIEEAGRISRRLLPVCGVIGLTGFHGVPRIPNSQAGLVANLKYAKYVRTRRVERAMTAVDRQIFLNGSEQAYEDRPIPIGEEQTISAPHIHAEMLELLSPHLPEGGRALDVGAGSGYLTACLREMVGPKGLVVGVEMHRRLYEGAREALTQWRDGSLEDGGIILLCGNALEEGLVDKWALYDAIHVGAAGSTQASFQLLKLLKVGGRLVIPEGEPNEPQLLKTYTKVEADKVDMVVHEVVGFVPLVPPDPEQAPVGPFCPI